MADDLQRSLEEFWARRRREVDEKFSRTLPFAEYVVDRWTKARELGFGEGASIYDSALVFGDVRVGAKTWIGPFVILDGSAGLEIGSNCSISAGVQIYTHHTVQRSLSMGTQPIAYAPTTIGNGVYLGPNVVIQMGVTIGDRVVIGANSFVNRDVGDGLKAFGSPARVQGYV